MKCPMMGCPNDRGSWGITFTLAGIGSQEIRTEVCDDCFRKVTDGVFKSFSLTGDIVDE